jgi:glycogen synthase
MIMNSYEKAKVESIRQQYVEEQPTKTKMEQLKELDRQVKRPAEIFAYTFGVVGSLVLGTGMCLAMKIIGDMMALGIVVGVIGIAMVSVNYLTYKKILARRKKKYGKEIINLSNDLLNE